MSEHSIDLFQKFAIDLPANLLFEHEVAVSGNPQLLRLPSLALFCSASAPAGVILQVHDWAQQWRRQGPLIVGGFQSAAEQEAFTVLLRGPQPVVQVLARGVPVRLAEPVRQAVEARRLLVVAPFGAEVKRVTAVTAQQRNRVVAALAGEILVAHAGPGSKTEQLVHEVLSWGKRVWTVDHPANANLIEMGIGAYRIG